MLAVLLLKKVQTIMLVSPNYAKIYASTMDKAQKTLSYGKKYIKPSSYFSHSLSEENSLPTVQRILHRRRLPLAAILYSMMETVSGAIPSTQDRRIRKQTNKLKDEQTRQAILLKVWASKSFGRVGGNRK